MRTRRMAAIALALLASLLGVTVHYLTGADVQEDLINADAQLLPMLFSDVLHGSGHLGDWILSPAPCFFPDYPMFLVAHLLGRTPFHSILVYAWIQVLCTFGAVWLLGRRTSSRHAPIAAGVATVSLVWLALRVGGGFTHILNNIFHYGTFLAAIVVVALLAGLGPVHGLAPSPARRRWGVVAVVAVLSFAGALSDNLFLPQVLVPLVVTTIGVAVVERDRSRTTIIATVGIAAATVLGTLAYGVFTPNPTRYPVRLGTDGIRATGRFVLDMLVSVVQRAPLLALIYLVYSCMVLGVVRHPRQSIERDRSRTWLIVFSALAIVCSIAAVASSTGIALTERYLIPALSWPVIVVFVCWGRQWRVGMVPVTSVVTTLSLASLGWASYRLVDDAGIAWSFRSSTVSCIDAALDGAHAHRGISQYWDAKHLQALSRHHPTMAPYLETLSEFPWSTSRRWFRSSYDFAILSDARPSPMRISSATLVRVAGPPRSIVRCGSHDVYLYGRDGLRLPTIRRVGDARTWQACDLPTAVGVRTSRCTTAASPTTAAGFLTSGPYQPLPPGRYQADIAYASDAARGSVAGGWDAILSVSVPATALRSGALPGTGGAPAHLVRSFVVPEGARGSVELRTAVRAGQPLEVRSVTIRRVA